MMKLTTLARQKNKEAKRIERQTEKEKQRGFPTEGKLVSLADLAFFAFEAAKTKGNENPFFRYRFRSKILSGR
jgi:hypothetical protein